MSNFRFQFKAAHFTYKNHLPLEELSNFIQTAAGEAEWISAVHENGHETGINYPHTHLAIKFKRQPNIRDPRKFDFGGIHPNIEGLGSKLHQVNTWKYHEKEPIEIFRIGLGPGGLYSSSTEQNIKNARTLYDACKDAGIEIKTVSDIKAIREDQPRRPQYVHKYEGTRWTLPLRTSFKNLFVYGPTGTGKTQWALHHFRNPYLCSHIDELRNFDANQNDGIVFDDMSFHHMPREGIIHLLDWDEDRSIHCRYYCAYIPAGTKKIFTSNKTFEETFPIDDYGAIRRRITEIIHVTGRTYSETRGDVDIEETYQELLQLLREEENQV